MAIVVSLETFLARGQIKKRKSSSPRRVPHRIVQQYEKLLIVRQGEARRRVPIADGDTLNIVFDV